MKISVLTPDKSIYQGEITSLSVPGIEGNFQMLENHAPTVSALGKGTVKIVSTNDGVKEFKIQKGFVEFLNNNISLLVQGVE